MYVARGGGGSEAPRQVAGHTRGGPPAVRLAWGEQLLHALFACAALVCDWFFGITDWFPSSLGFGKVVKVWAVAQVYF